MSYISYSTIMWIFVENRIAAIVAVRPELARPGTHSREHLGVNKL